MLRRCRIFKEKQIWSHVTRDFIFSGLEISLGRLASLFSERGCGGHETQNCVLHQEQSRPQELFGEGCGRYCYEKYNHSQRTFLKQLAGFKLHMWRQKGEFILQSLYYKIYSILKPVGERRKKLDFLTGRQHVRGIVCFDLPSRVSVVEWSG